MAIIDINGLPALVGEYAPVRSDFAPRQVMAIRVDADGCIRELYDVLAEEKLARIDFRNLCRTSRLARAFASAARSVFTYLQPPGERLSPHIQVHPRSRARHGD